MSQSKSRKPRNPSARVEAIVARSAAVAVVFRRGPSRWVRMLRWNLRSDRIEPGQWINARVNVERSDISPNGALVACFVASYRRAPGTWTTISRPPHFSALAVWPKGDTWGGGGLFVSDQHFVLDHDKRVRRGVDEFALMSGFSLPRRFRVRPFDGNSPVFACDIEQARMVLSGWRFSQRAVWGRATSDTETGLPFARPEIMTRPLGDPKQPRFELRRFVDGYGPPKWQAPRRIMRAEIHDLKAGTHRDLGAVEWVDADHKGDVLWSKSGTLFRLAGPTGRGMTIDAEPKRVADLNGMTFEEVEAPKRALRWP